MYLEIDGASNNSVDDIRELRENVGYTSMGGKYRIYVIDEVHMLSKSAFNALLKTIEEPPPNVIFIFATTEPQKIPATIHSRCQRYDFRRIVPEQIFKRLVFICDEEKIAFEKDAIMLIARKADGSMRDALSLLDQVCSYCQGNLTEQETRAVLGLVGIEVYEHIIEAVSAKTPGPVLALVQQVLYEGYDLHEFVVGFEEYMRNLLFVRLNGALQSTGVTMEPEMLVRFKRLSEHFTEGDLFRMIEIIRRSENDLKWSSLPRFAVEMLLLKLVFLDSSVSLERILSFIDDTKEDGKPHNSGGKLPVTGKPSFPSSDVLTPNTDIKKNIEIPSAGSSPLFTNEENGRISENKLPLDGMNHGSGSADRYNEREGADFHDVDAPAKVSSIGSPVMKFWHDFIDLLMRDRPNLGTFLSLATVAGNTDSSIDLTYPHHLAFQFGEVTKKQHREEISKMLNSFLGKPMELHITLETDTPEKVERNIITPTAHTVALESEIVHEPIIQSVLSIFDGDVLR